MLHDKGAIAMSLVNSLKHPLLFTFHIFIDPKKVSPYWNMYFGALSFKAVQTSIKLERFLSVLWLLNVLEMFFLRRSDFAIYHFGAVSEHCFFVSVGSGGIFVTLYLPSLLPPPCHYSATRH